MIKINAKRNKKTNKVRLSIAATGNGADIAEEAFKIITELPLALAENEPMLLTAITEKLSGLTEKAGRRGGRRW